MRKSLHKIVLSWFLIIAVGGHWPLLQSVAWVTMFVEFAQTDSFSLAAKKTFDGKHPCKICVLVKEGKQKEEKQTSLSAKVKLDFFLVAAEPFFFRKLPELETALIPAALRSREILPLLPPPRWS